MLTFLSPENEESLHPHVLVSRTLSQHVFSDSPLLKDQLPTSLRLITTKNFLEMEKVLSYSRSSGEGNGNPLQYSCLKNPMDREAWQATVRGVAKSQT